MRRSRSSGRSLDWPVIVMLVVAGVLRVGFLFVDSHPEQAAGLVSSQGEMARNIVDNGRWLVENPRAVGLLTQDQRIVDPGDVDFQAVDSDATFTPYNIELPGPSLMLAAIWSVTGSEQYIFLQLLQIAVDVLMAFLVYWVSLQLFKRRRAALVAGYLYATLLPLAAFVRIPFYDPWAAFIPLSVLAVTLKAVESQRRLPWLLASGLLVGFGLYFRVALILVPIALGVALWRRIGGRQAVAVAAIPACVALVCLAPLTIRNYAVFDRFIPANTGFGVVLWQGLGDAPNHFGAVNNDVETYENVVKPVRPDLRLWSPEYDDFLRDKAFHAIGEDPLFYGSLVLRRLAGSTVLLHSESPGEYWDVARDYYDGGGIKKLFAPVIGVVALSDYSQPLLVVVALATLVLTWRRYREAHLLLISVIVAVFLVPIFLSLQWRYLIPSLFAYLMLAGLGVDLAIERRRGRGSLTAGS
jgi:4-amino-4-deoxy-L-arabinose transferase-like glycosyltransferase